MTCPKYKLNKDQNTAESHFSNPAVFSVLDMYYDHYNLKLSIYWLLPIFVIQKELENWSLSQEDKFYIFCFIQIKL